ALALLLALAVIPSSPAVAMRGSGDLSPRLARLATPALRNASPRNQARALGLAAEGPGSLIRRGKRVLAYLRFERGAVASLAQFRAAGAQVVDASGRYQTVTVAAKPSQLRRLGRVPGVDGATPVLAPVTAATCTSGSVVSEGDAQLHADTARIGPP